MAAAFRGSLLLLGGFWLVFSLLARLFVSSSLGFSSFAGSVSFCEGLFFSEWRMLSAKAVFGVFLVRCGHRNVNT